MKFYKTVNTLLGTLAAMFLLASASAFADAVSVNLIDLNTVVYGPGLHAPPINQTTAGAPISLPPGYGVSINDGYWNGSATVSATAALGRLQIEAIAYAEPGTSGYADARANGYESFNDTLTVIDPGAPVGTPVLFLEIMKMNVTQSPSAGASYCGTTAGGARMDLGVGGEILFNNCTEGGTFTYTSTYLVHSSVGSTFGLEGDFAESFIGAISGDAPSYGYGIGTSSLDETINYYVESLTPGASARGATGKNYSPTPEPGSLLLLGTGLIGLAGMVRNKLHR
jgi:hypothetical protein